MNLSHRTDCCHWMLSRGLDMLLLVGIAGVFQALPKWSDNVVFTYLANQCHHSEWHGFRVYDLIFPLFVFIVGVSMPFALQKRLENKYVRHRNIYLHVIQRSLILFFLGLILNGFLGFDFTDFRYVNIFVHGFIDHLGSFKPVFMALCILTVKWLFLYFLNKQKIFLKV